jgi:hypothetical protein
LPDALMVLRTKYQMFRGSFDNPDNYAIDLVNEQKLRYDFVYW